MRTAERFSKQLCSFIKASCVIILLLSEVKVVYILTRVFNKIFEIQRYGDCISANVILYTYKLINVNFYPYVYSSHFVIPVDKR